MIDAQGVENAHKIIEQNVKFAREKAGLTQLQLALAIGHKSVGLVSCAEIYHKKQHFNIEHLLKIAAVLDIEVSELLKGADITSQKDESKDELGF